MRRPVTAVAVIAAALAIGACGGDSDEDEARAQVCDARADIERQVTSLRQLTPETVTADAVRTSVEAIGADIRKIGDAQADLSDERRADIKAASEAFAAELRDIGATLLQSTSVQEAKTRLEAATTQLRQSYSTTLARIECD